MQNDYVSRICRLLLFLILKLVRAIKSVTSGFSSSDPIQQKIDKQPTFLKTASVVISQPCLNQTERLEVVEIVSWCIKTGINYIFVFDPSGNFLQSFPNSRAEFQAGCLKANLKELRDLLPSDLGRLNWKSGWQSDGSNGHRGDIVVHLLEREDSMAPLLYAASMDSSASSKSQLENLEDFWTASLTYEDLKQDIARKFGDVAVMEPDIVLVAGPVFSLSYSPPWHSRFSEIYFLGPLAELNFDKFCSVIKQYWKTERRYGV